MFNQSHNKTLEMTQLISELGEFQESTSKQDSGHDLDQDSAHHSQSDLSKCPDVPETIAQTGDNSLLSIENEDHGAEYQSPENALVACGFSPQVDHEEINCRLTTN